MKRHLSNGFKISSVLLAVMLTSVMVSTAWADTPYFENVASSAGVANTGSGNGATWIDYDNDGDLDLYFVNDPGSGGFYRNNLMETGSATFTSVSVGVTGNGNHLEIADYDNDGYMDVLLGRGRGRNAILYRNAGNGTFTDVTASSGISVIPSTNCVWGDYYDQDGKLDLYFGDAGILYKNNGNGTFTDMTSEAFAAPPPSNAVPAWIDYDNDGYDDLFLAPSSSDMILYHNKGDGTFEDVSASAGIDLPVQDRRLAVGDYDGNGYDDIYVFCGGSDNYLFHNNGDGTFSEVALVAGVKETEDDGTNGGVEFLDFDLDGDLDLFANGGRYGSNNFFRNNGDRTFTDITALTGLSNTDDTHAIAVGDFDGDGYPDIYEINFTGYGSSANKLFLNTITEELPTTYYVDALNGDDDNDGLSLETAFATIQKGIDSANNGDTVIAAPGTYTGPGNRDIDFYGLAITVRSLDPNDPNIVAATIIDCNGTEDDPHRGFKFHSGEDANSVLAGFTITNGYATYGGGIYCESEPTITNCIFRGNTASVLGGGMYNYDSSLIVTNCIFRDNTAVAWGGGMHNNSSSPTVTGCFFEKNKANFGGGMDNVYSSPTVVNCLFSENYSGDGGGGMDMYSYKSSSPRAKLVNCIFSANFANNHGGGMSITYAYYSSPTLVNCTFSRNSATNEGGGMTIAYSYPKLTNCIFWGNDASTDPEITNYHSNPTVSYTDVQGGWEGEGNIDADPCFVEPGYWADVNDPNIPVEPNDPNAFWIEGDYHLLVDSPCINTGNPNGDYTGQTDIDGDQRVINGRVDMGADEFRGPIYVDNDAPEDPGPNNPDISDSNENGSFAHPFDAIQEAIDVASNGETVVVLDGTYTGSGNRDINFLGKAITVRSIDPNDPNIVAATIIDCQGTETERHRGFYFHSGEDANSVLAGFTITDGYVSVVTSWPCNGGGAIRFENSSPTIINCTITSNKAVATPAPGWCGIGGGLSCFFSDPTIVNCTIRYNSAEHGGGGGISCLDSNPKINNCIVTGNTSRYGGGAIYCNNSSPILSNSIIASNSARTIGGIDCANHSRPVITNCLISGNSAEIYGGGVGSWHDSRPTLTNCIISGNIARYGGGIFCSGSSPIVTNCTISDNTANVRGGGMYGGSPTVTNCIFWGNDYDEIYGGTPVITYSDVQGSWPGEGNIDADPCFIDPCNGDYHLLAGSLCIDAGDNTAVPADTADLDGDGNTTEPIPWDLDGNPRIVDGNDDGNSVVDMGAFEAMVSCFGVNHVKLETKDDKKGNKVDIKGTFSPALPIDFAVDDVAYIIDDGLGNTMAFLIPAGSFEVDGKPGKQKFKFDSPKGSQPDIKARFDFDKCKFELKAKRVQGTDEITSTTLAIELWAGANVVEEVVQVQAKPKHTEYKREPKLNCCPKCKGITLLEVTSTDPFTGDEYVLLFEPDPGKEKLKRKTVVDDEVNGRVKIDTSCLKPIDTGDVFGPYTITGLIKIFDD